MSKEVKFYLALTLIGLCISGAVYFYFESIHKYEYSGMRSRGNAIQNFKMGYIQLMCLCLAPILPLFFFAKNNRPK